MIGRIDGPGAPAVRWLGAQAELGQWNTSLYGPLRDWLTASGLLRNALPAGVEAPDFLLPDERGRLVSLSDLLAKGPVVLTFIPGSWCQFSLEKIRGLTAALRGRTVSVVALTPETGAFPRDMKARRRLDCVVLADVDYGVGALFGVIFAPPQAIVAEMKAHGVDLAERHGASRPLLPASALYVIAPGGKITMAQVDPDYMTQLAPERVLQALEAVS